MYQVKLTNRAEKELKKLAPSYKTKVTRLLNLLTENPFLGEKMSGEFKGWYRIKIPPIRIIYSANFQNKVISVRAIGHRGDIYK